MFEPTAKLADEFAERHRNELQRIIEKERLLARARSRIGRLDQFRATAGDMMISLGNQLKGGQQVGARAGGPSRL